MSSLGVLRCLSWAEGTSLLLLVAVGMPLKHLGGWALGVRLLGSLHGVLFMAFVATLLRVSLERSWPVQRWLALLLYSALPFGVIGVERALQREPA
jgi:integral membrane protein